MAFYVVHSNIVTRENFSLGRGENCVKLKSATALIKPIQAREEVNPYAISRFSASAVNQYTGKFPCKPDFTGAGAVAELHVAASQMRLISA